jgi:alkylation response protein AidB-like acyl-CoA dehydrogenase
MSQQKADDSTGDGKGYMTSERRLIRDTARDFTRREVLPVANRLDPQQGEIPRDLIEKMAAMGYFGILVPEEYGGLGLGAFEYCLVCEQLARGWMSVGSIVARGQASWLRAVSETPDAKTADMIRRAAAGEFLSASALSEPGTGSDLASVSCRAVRTEEGWEITGNKYWCTFADGADYLVVFARTSKPPSAGKRHLGISAFLIPKDRGTLPPNCYGNPIPKIGYFGWNTYELSFQGTQIPADALLGEEGKAFYLMASELQIARAHTAARSIGLAQGALEDSLQYAKERRQFGMPIAEFQAIRFMLAKMATKIEAARQLLYYVCGEIDSGRRCDTEASMVKLFASEMAEAVTSDAIQIHGGAGYTKLHAVERYWRDARLTKIFEGTSEIQQRIISDNLLGKSTTDRRILEHAFAGNQT